MPREAYPGDSCDARLPGRVHHARSIGIRQVGNRSPWYGGWASENRQFGAGIFFANFPSIGEEISFPVSLESSFAGPTYPVGAGLHRFFPRPRAREWATSQEQTDDPGIREPHHEREPNAPAPFMRNSRARTCRREPGWARRRIAAAKSGAVRDVRFYGALGPNRRGFLLKSPG